MENISRRVRWWTRSSYSKVLSAEGRGAHDYLLRRKPSLLLGGALDSHSVLSARGIVMYMLGTMSHLSGSLTISSTSRPHTPPVLAFRNWHLFGVSVVRRLAAVGSSSSASQGSPAGAARPPPVSTRSALFAASSWSLPSGRLAGTSSARCVNCTSSTGATAIIVVYLSGNVRNV